MNQAMTIGQGLGIQGFLLAVVAVAVLGLAGSFSVELGRRGFVALVALGVLLAVAVLVLWSLAIWVSVDV